MDVFRLHEPGVYDLPAFMDKVLNTTGASKLHYIGHSMGTTIFYILGSARPDLMDRVRLAVHLAPVTYWSRIQSPLAKRAFQAAAVLKVRAFVLHGGRQHQHPCRSGAFPPPSWLPPCLLVLWSIMNNVFLVVSTETKHADAVRQLLFSQQPFRRHGRCVVQRWLSCAGSVRGSPIRSRRRQQGPAQHGAPCLTPVFCSTSVRLVTYVPIIPV